MIIPTIQFNKAYVTIHGDRARFTYEDLEDGRVCIKLTTQFGNF